MPSVGDTRLKSTAIRCSMRVRQAFGLQKTALMEVLLGFTTNPSPLVRGRERSFSKGALEHSHPHGGLSVP